MENHHSDYKHTPGTWMADCLNNVWASGEKTHAKVANLSDRPQAAVYDEISEEENKANSILISAAPDMLVALEKADEEFAALGYRDTQWPRPQIREAIRKARDLPQ